MIQYEAVLEAREHLHPEVVRTPLLRWRHGTRTADADVRLKLETLQRTGSFKIRGAWNRMRLLVPQEREAGVLCVSAGNHAQGVALAAHLLGIQAVIVMPETVPQIKLTQTRLYGTPEIVLHGRNLEEAYDRAQEIGRERGLVFVHPYDDDAIIAGQGTVALELVEQWPDVDCVVVPVGGGGLVAGITIALRGRGSRAAIFGVQAKYADAMVRSIEAGRTVRVDDPKTIADGIRVGVAGERPFQILEHFDVPVLRVEDDAMQSAITALCHTAKLVVEPAGAAAAAALLAGVPELTSYRRIALVLSGANVDIGPFAETLVAHPDVPDRPVPPAP